MLRRRSFFATIAMCAFILSVGAVQAAPETKQPVKLFIGGTADSDFINAVYGEVLKEYGYRVTYVQSDYAAHYTALQTGDIDISLGAWQTVPAMTQKALDSGKVVNYGPTGVIVTEGWWYNNALKQDCPDLPKWEALKQTSCIKALVTPETAPAGRFVDGPADWGTWSGDVIKKLGLSLTLVNSGSPAALIATYKGALDRNEPILIWGYVPNWLFEAKQGAFVQLPGWKSNYDVLKLGNKEENARIPNAIAILRAFHLATADVRTAMDRVDNGGKTAQEAAREWMAKNETVWRAWLPK